MWNTLLIVLEALGLNRHCRQKCDIRAISDEDCIPAEFAEVLALNGETYVVSVNEFSATCNVLSNSPTYCVKGSVE